jgi:hypothetical protein
MIYSVTQLDGGFSITINGKTETFTEKFKLGSSATRTFPSLDRDKNGKLQLAGRGFYLLSELGLFQTDKRGRAIGESPTVESILAGATATSAAAAAPLMPPKVAAPVAPMSPELAQAIVAAAKAGLLSSKQTSAAATASGQAYTADEVAARINGKASAEQRDAARPTSSAAPASEAYSPDELAASINASMRR